MTDTLKSINTTPHLCRSKVKQTALEIAAAIRPANNTLDLAQGEGNAGGRRRTRPATTASEGSPPQSFRTKLRRQFEAGQNEGGIDAALETIARASETTPSFLPVWAMLLGSHKADFDLARRSCRRRSPRLRHRSRRPATDAAGSPMAQMLASTA